MPRTLSHATLGWFHHNLVDVAPHPVFARLKGLHERVARAVEVLGGVLVLRGVAAPHVAADETFAQVDPRVSHLQAFLTTIPAGCDVVDLVEMLTGFCHHLHLSSGVRVI
jgi:hypothetical protein